MRHRKKWGPTGLGVLCTAVILIAAYSLGLTTRAAINLPVMIILAMATVIDSRRKRIPDWLTLPGIVWVLVVSALLGWARVADALLGLVLCGGALLIFAIISRGSIGGGDVKLTAMIGASLGWQWGFGVLAFAQLSAALLALCLFVAGRKGRKDTLPFGPFLAAFALLALVGRPMQ